MNNADAIEHLGSTIKARLAAGDKAIEKAEDHYKAAGLHLRDAKKQVANTRGMTWPLFLSKHCNIGRSRADQLIAIADGRTTLAEIRAKTNDRVKHHRAKLPLRNGDKPKIADLVHEPSYDGDTAEQFWERDVSHLACSAVVMPDVWTHQWAEWKTFEVSPAILSLVQEAAEVWTELAADLTKRARATTASIAA